MLRSIERSERVYQAMLARGYTGQMRVLKKPKLMYDDYAVILSSIALFALILVTSKIL